VVVERVGDVGLLFAALDGELDLLLVEAFVFFRVEEVGGVLARCAADECGLLCSSR
jgi:hypothetical protein